MSAKIGVFPASGGLGSSIVTHLLRLVPASQLILITRFPDKLAELSRAGATVRRGDYDDPATLDRAFDGAIDQARRSGVKQIFYSSLAFGGDLGETSEAHVMGAHLATEKYLAELPGYFTYTAIREGIYSESFPIYTAWFDLHHPTPEITIPHNGACPGIAWAKQDELGEATAKMVVSYAKNPQGFPYLNRVVLLSGPSVWSLHETVDVLGRASGMPVKIREISVDQYANLPHHGRHTYHETDLAREWATAWEAIRRGETTVVSPVLREWLGREPEDFETTIRKLAR